MPHAGLRPAPSTIVFDLGGVLVDWNPRHLYRQLIADDAEREHFLSTVCTGAWNLEQDRGRDWAAATALLVDRFPAHRPLIEAYRARWIEMIGGPIAGTVAILERLAATGVPLYAITNWAADTFEEARPAMPFLRHFRGIVVSGVEKLLKPERAIFDLLCRRYGLAAGDCLFIDDVAHNVEGARVAGMHAIHFTAPDQLAADLRAVGFAV